MWDELCNCFYILFLTSQKYPPKKFSARIMFMEDKKIIHLCSFMKTALLGWIYRKFLLFQNMLTRNYFKTFTASIITPSISKIAISSIILISALFLHQREPTKISQRPLKESHLFSSQKLCLLIHKKCLWFNFYIYVRAHNTCLASKTSAIWGWKLPL